MAEAEQHAAVIRSAIASPAAAAQSSLAASWCRSALRHGLDPAHGPAADRLDAVRLAEARHLALQGRGRDRIVVCVKDN